MPRIRDYAPEQRALLSPYLLQHADNPVDWWEWSDHAFEEARRRELPVFLSSGYSSCHWCHVMAHESFEDPGLAEILNANFVSIKVDREERPDVDAVYMTALQAMTGHGGWPMSMFLDHDRNPFFAGTYYPSTARQGLPGFGDLLNALAEAWRERRDEIDETGARIVASLAERLRSDSGHEPTDQLVEDAEKRLAAGFDRRAGGFGGAPKFPPTSVIEFLLRRASGGDAVALGMAHHTCEAMARGGMYDQVGGGFARYSIDADWVVPHFEKMLYDNALLLRNYAHLWAVTGSELAGRVARETADFMLRELRCENGGFASSLDADSGGEEGSFYVWSLDELGEVLGDDAEWVAELCSVTSEGTFEHGRSVLQLRRDPDDMRRWQDSRRRLFAARESRIHPARDDSVITAWNGLAIGALARTGRLLGEQRYVDAAVAAAELMITVHLREGQLVRASRHGTAVGSAGVLEDHSDLAGGLLDVYAVTGDERWYLAAGRVIELMLRDFRRDTGGFRDARSRPGELVLELTDATDLATPSGASMAADVLVTYSTLSGRYLEEAAAAVTAVSGPAFESPRFAGWALAAIATWLDGAPGVALTGSADDPAWPALHRRALRELVAGAAVAVGSAGAGSAVPFLAERGDLGPTPAAFVCRNGTCLLPVNTAEDLAALLGPSRDGGE